MANTEAILAYAQRELERWHVPALELAAVKDGKVLLADAVGCRDVARGLPATPRTLFHHGSTGKAFTGVLAGTLVDDGLLDWDRPVRDYLPDFRLPEGMLADRLTTADLLSHRSGIARHDLLWLANPGLDRAELVRRLRHLPSPVEPRTTLYYSNLAYATVGLVIAALTGSTWEEQMRDRVLLPLGMNHSTTSVDDARAAEHAQPYVASRPNPDGEAGNALPAPDGWTPIPWRRSDLIAPAGGIMSCGQDIARWLLMQLGNGEVDGRRVISEAALARTRKLHTPIDVSGQDPDIWVYGYGFGWVIGTYRGRKLLWHNGGIDGFKTEIALLPDDGIGVAACANVLNTDLPLAVAYHMLDLLMGAEPKPWSDTLLAAQQAAPAEATPEAVEGTQPSHPLDAYAGDYTHPAYGTLRIDVDGEGLRAQLGEESLTCAHRHYDTWTVALERLGIRVALTFITDPEGRVSAAELPLEPPLPPIRFEHAAPETGSGPTATV